MSVTTELPLHEVILKIMYNEDREKPKALSPKDILWKIDNPEITERYVREVLDWLVRERKVSMYLDKYSLDRYEFLEQKTKNKDIEEEEEKEGNNTATFYIKPPQKKIKSIRNKIIFFIGVISILFMTYLFTNMKRDYELSTKEISYKSVVNNPLNINKLYLSNSDKLSFDKKFNDVSYSFTRQNINNENIRKELIRLYSTIDNLQKEHQKELNTIQKRIDRNINNNNQHTNSLIYKLIICNFIFLSIIIFMFIKSKI